MAKKTEKKEDPMDKVREAAKNSSQTAANGRRIGRMAVHALQPKRKEK